MDNQIILLCVWFLQLFTGKERDQACSSPTTLPAAGSIILVAMEQPILAMAASS